eukprot:TRINITY_DN46498_c0_g1_i2.p1 TRINITY_DN46498_c0_g1~~TRINITY_DN46498_c0_g1_i2.p1  ORF type:complete len:515 (-),score=77.90 TRINITY_DN46498_c0_g1_i2:84-1628(-)
METSNPFAKFDKSSSKQKKKSTGSEVSSPKEKKKWIPEPEPEPEPEPVVKQKKQLTAKQEAAKKKQQQEAKAKKKQEKKRLADIYKKTLEQATGRDVVSDDANLNGLQSAKYAELIASVPDAHPNSVSAQVEAASVFVEDSLKNFTWKGFGALTAAEKLGYPCDVLDVEDAPVVQAADEHLDTLEPTHLLSAMRKLIGRVFGALGNLQPGKDGSRTIGVRLYLQRLLRKHGGALLSNEAALFAAFEQPWRGDVLHNLNWVICQIADGAPGAAIELWIKAHLANVLDPENATAQDLQQAQLASSVIADAWNASEPELSTHPVDVATFNTCLEHHINAGHADEAWCSMWKEVIVQGSLLATATSGARFFEPFLANISNSDVKSDMGAALASALAKNNKQTYKRWVELHPTYVVESGILCQELLESPLLPKLNKDCVVGALEKLAQSNSQLLHQKDQNKQDVYLCVKRVKNLDMKVKNVQQSRLGCIVAVCLVVALFVNLPMLLNMIAPQATGTGKN